MRRARLVLVPLRLSVSCGAASAQDPARATAPCDGRIVSAVAVTPRDPSFLAIPRRPHTLARGVGLLHTTSTANVIGRFLLLEVGQRCTERQRGAFRERISRSGVLIEPGARAESREFARRGTTRARRSRHHGADDASHP